MYTEQYRDWDRDRDRDEKIDTDIKEISKDSTYLEKKYTYIYVTIICPL